MCCFYLTNIYAQAWTKSFTSGNYDSTGKFLGGSEVLQLINHKNKLFATIGYWEDGKNICYRGTNSSIGWGKSFDWTAQMDNGPKIYF